MSKTKQGDFEITYHHIDAPTIQDDEWGKEHKQRKLTIPDEQDFPDLCYRSSILSYLSDKAWIYSRKVDGANLRVQWDGEEVLWNGKTNKFVCGAGLTEYMNNTFLEEIFEEKFGRDKKVVLFGENMGPKVQGNELRLTKDVFILYDVNINGHWLCKHDVIAISKYFQNIGCVYDYALMPNDQISIDSLNNLINRVASGEFKDWEGIVARPIEELRDQDNNRIIVKIKNRDYYRGE